MVHDDEHLARALYRILTGSYVACSLICLVSYEYLITFRREVSVVWQRKLTVTSLLLLSVRWLMIFNTAVACFRMEPSLCQSLYTMQLLAYTVTTILISSFSALRVYALWQASKAKHALAAIVLVLGLTPIAPTLLDWLQMLHEWDYKFLPILAYCNHFRIPRALGQHTIFSDFIVIVCTWIVSFRHYLAVRKHSLGISITEILLRDGTIYFFALLVVNSLMLYTLGKVGPFEGAYAVNLVHSLPPLLVQRCMLNLRQFTEAGADFDSENAVSSFRIGNIGQPLDYNEEERLDDDDGDGYIEGLPWTIREAGENTSVDMGR
ncbi:hypothetical protein PsYK624_145570 [Phanerochaete sordida]|uniref:DUF6533 domain-containing protein n=1 Tax=Phanerochaete sordida TaxID=48140 RepID=A0A9P3GS06_9APHY|nr:hypothetical protein PsYK624_145570 [Phanerochaete sordida]